MGNFILPHVDVCGINRRVHGRFYGLDLKEGNGRLEKFATEITRLVNDEESGCSFEVQMQEHWILTRPTWLIGVSEMLMELFCD